MAETTSEERAARNEAAFREANEGIAQAADGMAELPVVPFICECDDPRCTEIIKLSLEDYRSVRSHPRHFVVNPGHEPDSEIVGTIGSFAVVEKRGRAGEVAEELAP